ncbi:MAG: MFS transporter [Anaerolineales bacterium]|nr:MFS transporter [Anaerolineales bacterium]
MPALRRLTLPTVLGLAHGVSDGAAGFLLGALPHTLGLRDVGLLVLLYNLLAFGAQPLVGWATDRLGRPRLAALLGLPLMGVALLVGAAQPTLAAGLAGLASALFHVGGGALALRATAGRAAGPGLFAAPGVVGLALGGALAITRPGLTGPFLAGLLICGALIAVLETPPAPAAEPPAAEPLFERHDWIMLGLLVAIALRSAVWSTLQFLLQGRVETALLLALAAAGGKILGGFLADRLGWRRWTLGALLGAAALLTLFPTSLLGLSLGVALLQSATPAALAAMARGMPRYPATAAGLALGFAIALGGLPLLAGFGYWLNSPPLLGALAALAGLLFWLALRPARAPAGVIGGSHG